MVKEIVILTRKEEIQNAEELMRRQRPHCRQKWYSCSSFFFNESNRVCSMFSFNGCKRVKGTMIIRLMQITGRQLLGETVLRTLVKDSLLPESFGKTSFVIHLNWDYANHSLIQPLHLTPNQIQHRKYQKLFQNLICKMNYAPSPRQDHIANTLICDKYPRFVSHQEKILSGTINKLKVASTLAKVK